MAMHRELAAMLVATMTTVNQMAHHSVTAGWVPELCSPTIGYVITVN